MQHATLLQTHVCNKQVTLLPCFCLLHPCSALASPGWSATYSPVDTREWPARKRKIIPVFNSMYTNILTFVLLSCQHNEDTKPSLQVSSPVDWTGSYVSCYCVVVVLRWTDNAGKAAEQTGTLVSVGRHSGRKVDRETGRKTGRKADRQENRETRRKVGALWKAGRKHESRQTWKQMDKKADS